MKWTTREGIEMNVRDMNSNHILNSVAMLERNINSGLMTQASITDSRKMIRALKRELKLRIALEIIDNSEGEVISLQGKLFKVAISHRIRGHAAAILKPVSKEG